MIIEEILAKLEGVEPEGGKSDQWNARCPCPDHGSGQGDRNASLSIGRGHNGATLVHCQGGCDTDAVLSSIGLSRRDLYEASTNGHATNGYASNGRKPSYGAKPTIVEQYDYRDESQTLLYQVCRMEPKDFRQRKPTSNGGWDWKTKGVRRVPYGLPELIESDAGQWVFFVEGEKDVDRLSRSVTATTLAGGAKAKLSNDQRDALQSLHGRKVVIIPDNDPAGRKYANAIAKELTGNAAEVRIIELPGLPEKGDVSDWLDAGHTIDDLIGLADAADTWTVAASEATALGEADETPDGRPSIELRAGCEDKTTEKALEALSTDPDVYVMGPRLVRVGEVDGESDPFNRSEGTLRIVPMTEPVIKVKLAAATRFFSIERRGENLIEVQKSCPADIVRAVATDGFWNGFRQLTGITPVPVMRPDGTVLDRPGYDRATRLILAPSGDIPNIKPKPSQQDAEDASVMLADVFADFPFENDRRGIAGCVAAVLALGGRPMIDGPCPMILVDGNRAGAGKTKIIDACGLIAGLSAMPRKSIPQDDAEFRKTITGVASAGLPAMLIDNIARPLGGDSLDAVLTSDVWQDRRLGSNEIESFPMRTVWFGTGNNVVLRGDVYRRVLRIALDCRHENPETRSDFRYPDLLGFVRANRTRLLGAALTMLRAWHVAGRPDGGLDTWGSFEAFSRVVRGTLAFSGMADPAPAKDRLELATKSDTRRAAIPVLLEAWPSEGGEPLELKASEIAKLAEEPGDFKDAIEQLLPSSKTTATGKSIGYALRAIRGHVVGGRRLIERDGRSRTKLWTVEGVS